MEIIVYSETTEDTVKRNLGKPEYSYYFVLKQFLPVLEELGKVISVRDPETEVDPIYSEARRTSEDCVFLSFAPPHKTSTNLECPTIPVFAWEFDTIPTETWERDPRHDWCHVLRKAGAAITHSHYSMEAIQRSLGPNFPAVAIPAPSWDLMAGIRASSNGRGLKRNTCLDVRGEIIDSAEIDFQNLDPLDLEGPHRVENYDYAVSIIRERDAQLQQRNADCAHAESIVRQRDAQLTRRNKEFARAEVLFRERDAQLTYAESVVRERDTQLAKRNEEFAHAEAVIREKDEQLARRNEDFAHAEAVIRERDEQLAKRNEEFAHAEAVIRERDEQLARRNEEFAHAEAVIRERDEQLAKRNKEIAHAESVVRERDAQLAKRNEEFAHAESIIRDQQDFIDRIQSTLLGRLATRLALRQAESEDHRPD